VIVLHVQWFDLRDAPHEDEDLGAEILWTKGLVPRIYPSLYSILQSGLWPQFIYCEPFPPPPNSFSFALNRNILAL
jgi:hypothetical protein